MTEQTPQRTTIERRMGEPRAALRDWIDSGTEGLLLVDFQFRAYWLPGEPSSSLTAMYLLESGRLSVSVTDQSLEPDGQSAGQQYRDWTEKLGLLSVSPGDVLQMAPLSIPKPWGQEIWYSGVEERGVCRFRAGGAEVPIPWLQAVLPGESAGAPGEALILLKILDPLPQEVTGDLYFELHREKREVYVVTRVDRRAWPDGTGFIRYGFNPDLLDQYADDERFRSDYLAAVRDYEAVRRRIDEGTQRPEDAEREPRLRAAMDRFTHMRPLQVGDVVKVPLCLPHSLQHGVRTVEFQTPVYERQILSFAQKVLTQDHWDTAAAVADMHLRAPPEEPFERLRSGDGLLEERVVDFTDFEVRRIRLQAGARYDLAPLERYAQVMVVDGLLALEGERYGPEDALLLPRDWAGSLASEAPSRPLVLLLALPR